MQDLINAHLVELVTAQEAQNDAIEAAQAIYSRAVDASRAKLMAGIDERLRVWNGEVARMLPGAAVLMPAPELETIVDAEKTDLFNGEDTRPPAGDGA